MSFGITDLTDPPLVGRSVKALAKLADEAGWYTWVVTGKGPEGASVALCGLRGAQGRFHYVWEDGRASHGYWWSMEHHVVDKGYRLEQKTTRTGPASRRWTTTTMVVVEDEEKDQVVRCTCGRPHPHRVQLVKELKDLLTQE